MSSAADADGGSSNNRALAWLAREASLALPATGPHLIGDFGRHRFPDVPLATLLGPRDEAWRARVAADPLLGRDAFPWFADGPEHLRGRALSLLWHEVRFRPLLSELEEEICESVLDDLVAAHRDAPELDYPAEAWAEVSALLGGHLRPPRSVFARDPHQAPLGIRGELGYRRLVVEREVGAGFSIRFPGALSEEEREDGIWVGDLHRSVHVAGIHGEPGSPADALLAEAPAPEGEPLELALAGLEVRAALREVGDETVLTAVAATEGCLCVLTAVERGRSTRFVQSVAASIALRR
ncbi:MAG: hypothetical protein H5U40_09220 [Polyangiaceae bacterium]|nr:hypothetical protein [Polyangiaceae bacterium]